MLKFRLNAMKLLALMFDSIFQRVQLGSINQFTINAARRYISSFNDRSSLRRKQNHAQSQLITQSCSVFVTFGIAPTVTFAHLRPSRPSWSVDVTCRAIHVGNQAQPTLQSAGSELCDPCRICYSQNTFQLLNLPLSRYVVQPGEYTSWVTMSIDMQILRCKFVFHSYISLLCAVQTAFLSMHFRTGCAVALYNCCCEHCNIHHQ